MWGDGVGGRGHAGGLAALRGSPGGQGARPCVRAGERGGRAPQRTGLGGVGHAAGGGGLRRRHVHVDGVDSGNAGIGRCAVAGPVVPAEPTRPTAP